MQRTTTSYSWMASGLSCPNPPTACPPRDALLPLRAVFVRESVAPVIHEYLLSQRKRQGVAGEPLPDLWVVRPPSLLSRAMWLLRPALDDSGAREPAPLLPPRALLTCPLPLHQSCGT